MNSGWEIAADVLGGVSALLLLAPAFGVNATLRLVAKLKLSLKQWRQSDASLAHDEDYQRALAAHDKAAQSTQRWSTWDECQRRREFRQNLAV